MKNLVFFKNITLLSLLFCTSLLSAQDRDSIPDASTDDIINRDLIEEFIASQEATDFDFNTLFELLEYYAKKPLNLNKATAEELADLKLLTDIQIQSLVNYRTEAGEFIAIEELQAVPGFTLQDINRISPFVDVKGDVDDYRVPIWKMMGQGKNEVYLRWDRVLEQKKGYTAPPEDDPEATRYLGTPDKVYIRYRHQYETRLSYGITLEKDPGEELFRGSQKGLPGFDFWSLHFFMKDYNKYIKGLALGDFAVNMGQGLVMFDGFGGGKSAFVSDIKRSGRPIRQYTSVGEDLFKRGAAANINLTDNLEVMGFFSYRGRDANATVIDSLDEDIDVLQVSSLQLGGLHRTQAQVDDKNSIKHLSTGGTIKYKGDGWHIAANGLIDKLSSPLQRNFQYYNQFTFNGDRLMNASLDYSWVYQNFNFFGETAISDNKGVATVNGLIIGLDRKVTMSAMHRHYQRNYQALFPNAFGETSNVSNESGLYLGLDIRPNKHWKISGYFDTWRHPWLRSSVDAPTQGHEYLTRITYKRKRKMEVYLQFRDEFKEKNAKDNETAIDFLVDTRRSNLRLNIANKVSKALELRNRAEYVRYDNGTGNISQGYMLLQDIIYKPIGIPLSFTSRFALFDTDDYDSRIYVYENDILYSFSIPPYYNRGTRFYLNLRYRGIRNMTLEFRFAQTYYSNQETFGSGLEEINKPRRSEVKMQMKYKF